MWPSGDLLWIHGLQIATVCLHCFLRKSEMQWHPQDVALGVDFASDLDMLLNNTIFQIVHYIFNRVHTIHPDQWEVVSKLCSFLPPFIAQSTHSFAPSESRRACKGCTCK